MQDLSPQHGRERACCLCRGPGSLSLDIALPPAQSYWPFLSGPLPSSCPASFWTTASNPAWGPFGVNSLSPLPVGQAGGLRGSRGIDPIAPQRGGGGLSSTFDLLSTPGEASKVLAPVAGMEGVLPPRESEDLSLNPTSSTPFYETSLSKCHLSESNLLHSLNGGPRRCSGDPDAILTSQR